MRTDCPAGGERWTDGHCVPEGVVDPPLTWVLDYAVPIVGGLVLMMLVAQAVSQRRLTWSLSIALCSASCWWLETFGDWGQHLLYSPNFHHYSLDWSHTAPHNPAWMPVMYAVYWVAHAWAILRAAQWLQRRRPGLGLGRAIVYLSIPLTFGWNLVIEGFAAYLGWWTYEPAIGPEIDMGRGNWPLLWPMLLMFGWINLIAWMVGPPEDASRPNLLDRLFRLDRLLARPGWTRSTEPVRVSPVGAPGSATAVPGLVVCLRYGVGGCGDPGGGRQGGGGPDTGVVSGPTTTQPGVGWAPQAPCYIADRPLALAGPPRCSSCRPNLLSRRWVIL